MKVKQLFAAAFCTLFIFSGYGQSGNNDPEYRKFCLSVNAGWDFALGSSSTVLAENLSLPAIQRGFSPGFDGAWFFSRNYGVGIKYGFYTANHEKESYHEYTGHSYDYPVYEYSSFSFKEETHILGPAVYARWSLGDSKWMVLGNAGVVMLHNKLSGIEKETSYDVSRSPNIPDPIPGEKTGAADHGGTTAGFTLTAAIRYQIAPFAGISLQTNGLYASLTKMKYYNQWEERHETRDFSRKTSRVGLSAAIDFCF